MIKLAIVVSGLYIAAQIFSDITAVRVLNLFGLSIDAGTLIYPITFTLRDLLHKTTDKQTVRLVIIMAAVINLFMALFFWLVSTLPADLTVGAQQEFGLVLAPLWRIVFASIIAEVVSEFLDTELYHKWTEKFGQKHQYGRVLFSNIFSVPTDTILFVLIAFAGVLPTEVVFSIGISNMIVKYLVSIVSMPTIYLIPNFQSPKN